MSRLSVDANALGQLLKEFRLWSARTIRELADDINRIGARRPAKRTLRRLMGTRSAVAFLTRLESDQGPQDWRLGFRDIHVLAGVYDIPPLMLDPLFSTKVNGHVQRGSLGSFIKLPRNHAKYGTGHYAVPNEHLHSSDAAFVLLTLEPGSSSDFHDHPGDELIFVRRGTIEVRLHNSGVNTRLEEGEYIHFRSELPHSAHNVSSGKAVAFIIRQYQFRPRGVRREIAQSIDDALDALDEIDKQVDAPKSAHILRDAIHFMRGTLVHSRRSRHPSSEQDPGYRPARPQIADVLPSLTRVVSSRRLKRRLPPDEVWDRFGLGRMLERARTQMRRAGQEVKTLEALAKSGRELGCRFNTTTRIFKLQRGREQVKRSDLLTLAKIYDVPAFLLYEFLFPTNPYVVAIHNGDWAKLPNKFAPGRGVRYEIPQRHLPFADIAIVRVELQPRKTIRPHRHVGHELLLPDKGRIGVRFDPKERDPEVAGVGEYLHFESNNDHEVFNPDSTLPSVAYAIRFYD